MPTVRENLIAARALLADEATFLNAYQTTGSAVAWAFDEVTKDEAEVREMFAAVGKHWEPYRGAHSVLLGNLDRAIAASETK